jgi:hypothetical protein
MYQAAGWFSVWPRDFLNGRGYVLDIQRTLNLPDTRVHHHASALRGR